MEITKVKERNNSVVMFDRARIKSSIEKACTATGVTVCSQFYASVTDDITQHLGQRFFERIPGVEDIEEVVEMTLADRGLFETARAYTLSREEQIDINARASLLDKVEHG